MFQFSKIEDKAKVLDGRPWNFDNLLLVLESIEQDQQFSDVNLTTSPFRVHVVNMSIGMCNASSAKRIGETLGQFMEVDDGTHFHLDETLRIRVRLEIQKALRRGMRLELKSGVKKWVDLKYERLGTFCYYCGIMGHSEKFCAKKIADKVSDNSLPYGPWLRAVPRARRFTMIFSTLPNLPLSA